jgi:molybdate transport system regulatory protein
VARIRLRVYVGDEEHPLGPGKVRLLEAVRDEGSISAAARRMGMAYRHAWVLVDSMNRAFRHPVVTASPGGRAGGGAHLTPFGEEVVRRFHAMEQATRAALAEDLDALDAEAAKAPSRRR